MSNYSALKTAIQQAVYTNGNNEITGAGLQAVLLQIVNTVGDGYVFKGVATAGTAPGTPDANVFYIAPAGTYENFGSSYTVPDGNIGVFSYNGTWSKEVVKLTSSGNAVYVINSPVIINTPNNTLTIPAQTIYFTNPSLSNGRSYTLASDVVLSKPADWNIAHVYYNEASHTFTQKTGYYPVTIDEGEYYFGTLRYPSGRFISINSFSYYSDGALLETDFNKDEIEGSISKIVQSGGYADIEFHVTNTNYKKLERTIPAGSKCELLITGVVTTGRAVLYGKTNTADSGYITIEPQSTEGRTYFYPTIDVNYIRANPGGSYTLTSFDAVIRILPKSEPVSPCMKNRPLDLRKSNLRIFDIGNSYTQDAQHYLPDILSAAGETTGFSLYSYIRGSASFGTIVSCFNDSDPNTYTINKVAGDTISDITTGTGAANDGSLFRNALQNGNWDLILIHQVSTYANEFNRWPQRDTGGYLNELIRIIKIYNPQATIGYLMPHSYRSTYSGNTEGSSALRWANIAKATQKLMVDYGIDFIVPYGTAVQNLRTTSLNDSNEFSTDGTHMADGLGDYCAACCYYEAIFAPRFGKSIYGNTFTKTDLDESVAGVKNITSANAHVAQKAAIFAVNHMFELWAVNLYSLLS